MPTGYAPQSRLHLSVLPELSLRLGFVALTFASRIAAGRDQHFLLPCEAMDRDPMPTAQTWFLFGGVR